jgi:hypothetical protein
VAVAYEDWSAAENEDVVYGDVIHVFPLDDLIEHDTSPESGDTCVCGPEIEPVERSDGTFGWVVMHGSLDGREHTEPDHDYLHCPVCRRGPA